MLHDRLIETIASHASIVEEAANRGIDWSETLQLYAVLHALQVHAQAVIDYLLHTCPPLRVITETPPTTLQLKASPLKGRGEVGGSSYGYVSGPCHRYYSSCYVAGFGRC